MRKTPVYVSRVLLLVSLMSALYGCGSGSSETPPATSRDTDTSDVSIYNLVTTSVGTIPSLGVTSGLLISKSEVATTPYLASGVKGTLRWSKNDPTVFLGFTPSGSENSLFGARLAFEPGITKTLCLVGQADSLTDRLKPEVLVLNPSTTAPAPGTFRVRFVNAVTDLDRVDLYVASEEEVSTSNSIVSPLFYKTVTNYIELPVPARGKKLTLAATNMGVAPNPETDLIRLTGNDVFTAGHIYFVALAHKTSRLGSPLTFMIAKER